MTADYNISDPRRSGSDGTLETVPKPAAPTSRRRPRTEKELYAEAAERARSLREKLLARRSKNRDKLVEDLYRVFAVEAVDGDFDDAERLSTLRSCLNEALRTHSSGGR